MIIQIFGTKKCKDTQKAIRFFKERKIASQIIDLTQKGLSKGEIHKVALAVGRENLINKESETFLNNGLKYASYDEEDILFKYPLIMVTPLVRCGNKATVGYAPEGWKSLLDQ